MTKSNTQQAQESNNGVDLQAKAINIKGKDYVLVSDRILAFNSTYPNGSIETELLSSPGEELVIFKATVTPSLDQPTRRFTGYSQARWGEGYINKVAAMENAETSAVGRALGMMGIGVLESGLPTAEEMRKSEEVKPYGEAPKKAEPKVEDEVEIDGIIFKKLRGSKNGKTWVGWFPPKDSGKQVVWGENPPVSDLPF